MATGRLSDAEVMELPPCWRRSSVELGYSRAADSIADFLPSGEASDVSVVRAEPEHGLRLLRLSHRRYLSQAGQVTRTRSCWRAAGGQRRPGACGAVDAGGDRVGDGDAQAAHAAGSRVADRAVELRRRGVGAQGAARAWGAGDPRHRHGEARDRLRETPDRDEDALPAGRRDDPDRAERGAGGSSQRAPHLPGHDESADSETVSGPSSQLLAMFHPSHPEQHSAASFAC